MQDFIWTPLVFLFGVAIHLAVLRIHSRLEGQLLTIGFGAHAVSAIANVLLVLHYFEGGGDMLGYFEMGVPVADLLSADFFGFAPEVLKAFFRDEKYLLPVELFGGGSTMSMSAAASFILFFTGSSLYSASMLVAVGSYLSGVMIYRALRDFFPSGYQLRVLIGTTLLPSAVFWSSALLKEPLVFCGIGPVLLGLKWFTTGQRRVLSVVSVVAGAVIIAMIKPYVLMALSVSAAVFYLWNRLFVSGRLNLRPSVVIVGFALATAGLLFGLRYFEKRGSGDGVSASTIASQRRAGYGIVGGSNFRLESAEEGDTESRSYAQELLLAPVALVTALFRPFIFEARNAVQLVNALEATFLLIVFIRALRAGGLAGTITNIRQSSALMFCFVFAFSLALGTGLATSNMGTLSRYRAPMMPFFFTLLLVLEKIGLESRKKLSRVTRPLGPEGVSASRAP